MRCDECKYWIQNTFYTYPGVVNTGICDGIQKSSKVTFTVYAGWDGGYVSAIETDSDFFCFEFSVIED